MPAGPRPECPVNARRSPSLSRTAESGDGSNGQLSTGMYCRLVLKDAGTQTVTDCSTQTEDGESDVPEVGQRGKWVSVPTPTATPGRTTRRRKNLQRRKAELIRGSQEGSDYSEEETKLSKATRTRTEIDKKAMASFTPSCLKLTREPSEGAVRRETSEDPVAGHKAKINRPNPQLTRELDGRSPRQLLAGTTRREPAGEVKALVPASPQSRWSDGESLLPTADFGNSPSFATVTVIPAEGLSPPRSGKARRKLGQKERRRARALLARPESDPTHEAKGVHTLASDLETSRAGDQLARLHSDLLEDSTKTEREEGRDSERPFPSTKEEAGRLETPRNGAEETENGVPATAADERSTLVSERQTLETTDRAFLVGEEQTRGEGTTVAALSRKDKGQEDRSLYVSGHLEGCKLRFLVDTGAERSVFGQDVLEKLPTTKRMAFRTKSCNLLMADGSTATAPGPVLCEVLINGRTILEPFCVLPGMTGAILGTPALRELGSEMEVAGIKVLSSALDPRIRRLIEERVMRIRAVEEVEIPARSEKLVLGRAGTGANGLTVMIGPEESAGNLSAQLMVARSVGTPVACRLAVRVCNTSNEAVKIPKGLPFAEAQLVQVVEQSNTRAKEEHVELPEHLIALWRNACERGALSDEVADQLKTLLAMYSPLFAKHDNDFGRTTLVEHSIDTGDTPPIRQPPRRVPGGQLEEFEAEIQRMLEAGVIEPGQSPWASPVVLVRKKDGSVRFCVDYRRLNMATKFDAYPLPRIDETLEALGGTQYFSTLDLISGYWQVGLTEEARQKTAFTTRNGLFLWNVMPYGLCNAPSTFERLMETVLRGLQWKQCLVYLDDVVVFARNEAEMLERLDTVFGRLMSAGLKLKPRKCSLFARETEYLGHVVSANGIHVNPNKVSAVKEWPVPQSKTEVRSFLGTASYYRRFVQDFATIAAPLHAVAAPKTEWEWGEKQQRAFDELKEALCTAPVLAFPVPDAPYILDTDASLTGIGAVLSQLVDGKEMVLAYSSEALDPAERNYCVTRRELLAVIKALRHFHCYVYKRQFVIRTDHSSLRWLVNFREPKDQLARWVEELSQYANQFTIEHRPGAKHGNADGLSRIPCRQCHREECSSARQESVAHVRLIQLNSVWTNEMMAQEQEQDPEIQPVLTALKADKKPTRNESASWPKAARRYLADWARLKLRDGVVWREWYDEKGAVTAHQFITPRSLRGEVMQQAHDQRMAGHFGVARTLDRLRAHYYWSGMTDDVDHWLRSCGVCACRKAPPKRPHHALERQVVAEPNQRVAIDILGPFEPPADSGNLHVMVMTDYLTKWVEAVPMPDKTQERCAEVFVVHWVLRFGPPEQLLTDQGAQFEARMFQEMCRILDIEKLRTTAYHPQGDGQTERANRTILALLNKLAVDTPRNWDVRLPFALAAYRSSVHTVTRMTPNRLMHGQEARTPLALLVPSPPRAATTTPYCQQLKARFEETHRLVAETIKHQHRTAQPHLDRRSKMMVFKEGDLVWLYKPNLHKGISRKLAKECWSGPWEVVKAITTCVYTIRFRGTRMTRTVNVDVLNPYVTRSASRFPGREEGAKRREGVQVEEDTTESRDAEEETRAPSYPGVTAELITGQSEHTASTIPAVGEGAEITGRPRRLHKTPPRLNDFIVQRELKTSNTQAD
jgi:hypothetical protein